MKMLIAPAVLAAIGLLWMFVNIKTNAYSPTKTASLVLMWVFLGAATVLAVVRVWGLL